MQDDEVRSDLNNADEAERLRAVRYPAEHEAQPDFFAALTERIPDPHDAVRFFALSALVLPYQEQLRAHAARLVPLLMGRLLDDNGTVTDRAIWALNIVGETALPHLLAATESPRVRLRTMAAYALARNHQMHTATDVALPALLRLLDDANEGVRFTAMCEVMNLTPLRTSSAGTLTGIDMEPIYARLLPLAQQFSQHQTAHIREWAARMLTLLHNR